MTTFNKFKSLVINAVNTGKKKDTENAYSYFVDHIDENDLDAYIVYLNQSLSSYARSIADLCQSFIERYESENSDEFVDDFDVDDFDVDDFEVEEEEEEEEEEEVFSSEYYERMAQSEIFTSKFHGHDRLGYKTGVGSLTAKIAKARAKHCKALLKAIKASDKATTRKLLAGGSTSGIFGSKYRRERAIKIVNHRINQWQRKAAELA